MDMRPQAHEIIRTWLFSSVVRSHYEHDSLPWANAAISGFIVDPDRKKLSKSAGGNDDPVALIAQYGADAVRYWSANGRPGMDMAFDEGQMKIGRRLAIKLLNASKFALGFGAGAAGGAVTAPLDRAMLVELADLVDEATTAFDRYDYARALERTEAHFWSFCDDYLELVKNRAYAEGAGAESATAALALALEALLALFAPFLPYVTEEVWSWWRDGSIHRSPWPDAGALRAAAAGGEALPMRVAADVLTELRRAKSEAKRSMRAPIAAAVVTDTAERLAALELVADDLTAAGAVAELTTQVGDAFAVDVTLPPEA
jgi:valyl-tRNA synthetase